MSEQATLAEQVRYHKKRDGILRIEPNGRARFLTFWEMISYWFGGRA